MKNVKTLPLNIFTSALFSMGLLISSNAQANYNLAKSSLDEIRRDAQIELNKAIDATNKTKATLQKMGASPFSGVILGLMLGKGNNYTYNDFVKDFNSLPTEKQYDVLGEIGNKSTVLSRRGLDALLQPSGVNLSELGKEGITAYVSYKYFEALRKFEDDNMSYLSDIQHGPNLIASQYAELQFNLHMLNKMNKFQSGAYADLVNTSLYEKEVNVKMPYLVVGYQYQIGNNMKLGTFANFAVDSISRNSKYSKDDEAIGIGFNASYKWGASTIALLTNIIRHNQSFTANQSEIFTVYPPTARYHLYSGNVTFKADYAYQTTAALSLTPGLTYQYNYTQGKEVETNSPGADFTSPSLKTQSVGLNLLTQYQQNGWTIGLDLGAAYFKLRSGETNEFGKLGYYQSIDLSDTSNTVQADRKVYYVQSKDRTYRKNLSEYKLYANLDFSKKLNDKVNVETMIGYTHYTKTKLHGVNWGVKFSYLF
ncbi:autotransporter domain-containing protein [Avibacterium paragallinarum]|uniref:autotransporter domain-containing protein n=3 Tax=Avibacterium paragallinarum TaxID=728 RepID=UPI0006149D38|nr:autotransporter domain-containing protein [Avibacterium paragallinarum]AZI14275.1 hypothetical protein EIA51_06395 [Avibacterium paragallinarum]QIR11750.1 autotransporter outer membrane beta-barrel domain-containing protein [Avibacterium paragallinarum]QJE09277.1 autotransporter outer membrane beta-barrel domain-containing protein [Avibacterium paragallinarum]QJE11473.1 autotransporter outer membrane beta-barrel domain-containing protein [Avibacterium paragallinarum]QJE13673.1 autotransport